MSAEKKSYPSKFSFENENRELCLTKKDFCLVFVPLGSLKLSFKGFDKVSGECYNRWSIVNT